MTGRIATFVAAMLSWQAPPFHAETRLVVLHATVRNARGELVTGLDRQAFSVFENGRRQPIAIFRNDDVPVSIGLLIDNSGSMRAKRSKVEAAALAFARASNPDDELFVVNFADKPRLDVPFTNDIHALEERLSRVDSIGGTAMRDAVDLSLHYMRDHARRDRRVLVIFTDGNDNASTTAVGQIRHAAEQAEVAVYAVGLLNDGDDDKAKQARKELDRLTEPTGGVSAFPDSLERIGTVAVDLARQIRTQYTIGYTPQNQALDGSYRRIEVAAKGPTHLEVRTRRGYRATPDLVKRPSGSASNDDKMKKSRGPLRFTPVPSVPRLQLPLHESSGVHLSLRPNTTERRSMTRYFFTAPAVVLAAALSVPSIGRAQTFKVEKFDIKGDGGTDYLTVEPATGRVFVARSTHMMVVEGATGKVLGDIPNTPGVHGAGLATKVNHGFTTNGGDETVTMFDLKTLAVLKQIKVGPGLDGIMYDEPDDKIILTNHSRPIGTLTAIDPKTGDIVATAELEDTSPEGAAADGKGHIFVNNERKNTIQVIDVKTWKATASWPLAPCDGPTGIAYDKASNRIFSGCNKTSVVVDPSTGKIVASFSNGTRVDALGWDPAKKLIYIPNGGEGNVTVVHQDSPDKYSVVATVPTFAGAKTITVDPVTHNAYLFQPERGPAPADAPAPAAGAGPGRGPQRPIVAAWFIVIKE